MKKSFLLILIFATTISAVGQIQSHYFETCFSKANKKSIKNKMDNFLLKVSEETN